MYCYEGDFWSIRPNPFIRFWDQLRVTVSPASPDNIQVTQGVHSIAARDSIIPRNASSSRPLCFSPYESSCAAIQLVYGGRGTGYRITADFQLNLIYPVLFLVGTFLLFLSPKYSRNSASVYTAGVLVGVLGSVLVLIYFFSRLIPGVRQGNSATSRGCQNNSSYSRLI